MKSLLYAIAWIALVVMAWFAVDFFFEAWDREEIYRTQRAHKYTSEQLHPRGWKK